MHLLPRINAHPWRLRVSVIVFCTSVTSLRRLSGVTSPQWKNAGLFFLSLCHTLQAPPRCGCSSLLSFLCFCHTTVFLHIHFHSHLLGFSSQLRAACDAACFLQAFEFTLKYHLNCPSPTLQLGFQSVCAIFSFDMYVILMMSFHMTWLMVLVLFFCFFLISCHRLIPQLENFLLFFLFLHYRWEILK